LIDSENLLKGQEASAVGGGRWAGGGGDGRMWLECVGGDMRQLGLRGDDARGRQIWKVKF